jgi:hypothetical protein
MVKRSFSDAFSQVSANPQTSSSKAEKRKYSSAFVEEEDEIQSLTKRFQKCQVKVARSKPNLDVAASLVEVLGNLMSDDFVIQGKSFNEVINVAAKGEEWQHLFSPEQVRLLKQIVTLRSCSKNGTLMTEQQELALLDSFRKVKASLFLEKSFGG